MDQQGTKFKVAVTGAAVEKIPRDERKTKQNGRLEDILDLMETGR